MTQVDLKARLERARHIGKVHGIAQAQIASDLDASQSQISRILMGQGQKMSRLAEEVCLYLEKYEGGVTAEAVKQNEDLIHALTLAWDGTAKHAKALSTVIRSLTSLRPVKHVGDKGETVG